MVNKLIDIIYFLSITTGGYFLQIGNETRMFVKERVDEKSSKFSKTK
jgi:hypothetical protein